MASLEPLPVAPLPGPVVSTEPLLPAPELDPLLLPLAFIADSNSVRLIWPLLSASARLNSSPGTLAASDRSMKPLLSASSCEKLDAPPVAELLPLAEPLEPVEPLELLPLEPPDIPSLLLPPDIPPLLPLEPLPVTDEPDEPLVPSAP